MSKTIEELKKKKGQKDDDKQLKYLRVKTSINLIEEKADEPKGIIEAYVSIFDNVDLGGDKIIKGAFKESLAKKLPKGVWMHNWDEPIAKTLKAKEDEKGLYIKGQLIMEVQRAKEAYALMKEGVIDEFSIGYRVLEDEWEENGTRILKKIKLYEWSPVLAGMNPDTELIGIKEEKKPEAKVNYVNVNEHRVKIHYSDGKIERKKISFKYKKHILSLLKKKAEKREKVDGGTAKIVLRLAKKVDKINETIIKIMK